MLKEEAVEVVRAVAARVREGGMRGVGGRVQVWRELGEDQDPKGEEGGMVRMRVLSLRGGGGGLVVDILEVRWWWW